MKCEWWVGLGWFCFFALLFGFQKDFQISFREREKKDQKWLLAIKTVHKKKITFNCFLLEALPHPRNMILPSPPGKWVKFKKKSKLGAISNFHSSILKQFVCTLKETLKISVCMWRQPSVSKRTLSECDKEKATGGSAPVGITVCCNSVILSCQNLGPEITPSMFSSRLSCVQLLLFWIAFINSDSSTALLLTFRENTLRQSARFSCAASRQFLILHYYLLYCKNAVSPGKNFISLLINTFLCTSVCFLSPSFSHIVQKS